jgi:hypothetical protein
MSQYTFTARQEVWNASIGFTSTFDISGAYAYNMSPQVRREIRKIVFQHFDYIVDQWVEFQARRRS